jgi:hypothetical protein
MRLNATGEVEIGQGDHIPTTFLLGIPTFGMVPIEFVVSFGRMSLPMSSYVEMKIAKGMEVGVARNWIVEKMLKMASHPTYLLFVGDDMLPPWDGLLMLHEEMKTGKWDVLSGLYFKKGDPPEPLLYRLEIPGPLLDKVHYNLGEVVPVDRTGLDFTLIKSNIFTKLGPPPWFKTAIQTDSKGSMCVHTEDTFFYDKCRNAGLKVGVHTGVRVAHYLINAGEVF